MNTLMMAGGPRSPVTMVVPALAMLARRMSAWLVDGLDRVHEEGQNRRFSFGASQGAAGSPRVRGQAPVVVLAAAVHACVRFLAQQHPEVVVPGDLLHEVHQEHVVVHREVGLLEHGAHSNWLGPPRCGGSFDGDAQLEGLGLEVAHEGMHAVRDGTEVMVLQLLTLGRVWPKSARPVIMMSGLAW